MKDIKLNTTFLRTLYVLTWISFIVNGMLWAWLLAAGLSIYGIDTKENKPKVKMLLNKSYQKFIFVYGLITGGIAILLMILGCLMLI